MRPKIKQEFEESERKFDDLLASLSDISCINNLPQQDANDPTLKLGVSSPVNSHQKTNESNVLPAASTSTMPSSSSARIVNGTRNSGSHSAPGTNHFLNKDQGSGRPSASQGGGSGGSDGRGGSGGAEGKGGGSSTSPSYLYRPPDRTPVNFSSSSSSQNVSSQTVTGTTDHHVTAEGGRGGGRYRVRKSKSSDLGHSAKSNHHVETSSQQSTSSRSGNSSLGRNSGYHSGPDSRRSKNGYHSGPDSRKSGKSGYNSGPDSRRSNNSRAESIATSKTTSTSSLQPLAPSKITYDYSAEPPSRSRDPYSARPSSSRESSAEHSTTSRESSGRASYESPSLAREYVAEPARRLATRSASRGNTTSGEHLNSKSRDQAAIAVSRDHSAAAPTYEEISCDPRSLHPSSDSSNNISETDSNPHQHPPRGGGVIVDDRGEVGSYSPSSYESLARDQQESRSRSRGYNSYKDGGTWPRHSSPFAPVPVKMESSFQVQPAPSGLLIPGTIGSSQEYDSSNSATSNNYSSPTSPHLTSPPPSSDEQVSVK